MYSVITGFWVVNIVQSQTFEKLNSTLQQLGVIYQDI